MVFAGQKLTISANKWNNALNMGDAFSRRRVLQKQAHTFPWYSPVIMDVEARADAGAAATAMITFGDQDANWFRVKREKQPVDIFYDKVLHGQFYFVDLNDLDAVHGFILLKKSANISLCAVGLAGAAPYLSPLYTRDSDPSQYITDVMVMETIDYDAVVLSDIGDFQLLNSNLPLATLTSPPEDAGTIPVCFSARGLPFNTKASADSSSQNPTFTPHSLGSLSIPISIANNQTYSVKFISSPPYNIYERKPISQVSSFQTSYVQAGVRQAPNTYSPLIPIKLQESYSIAARYNYDEEGEDIESVDEFYMILSTFIADNYQPSSTVYAMFVKADRWRLEGIAAPPIFDGNEIFEQHKESVNATTNKFQVPFFPLIPPLIHPERDVANKGGTVNSTLPKYSTPQNYVREDAFPDLLGLKRWQEGPVSPASVGLMVPGINIFDGHSHNPAILWINEGLSKYYILGTKDAKYHVYSRQKRDWVYRIANKQATNSNAYASFAPNVLPSNIAQYKKDLIGDFFELCWSASTIDGDYMDFARKIAEDKLDG